MRKRYDAQRQNIIESLDNLIFQLYSVSFFLAPALLPLLCRVASQFMSFKPREDDSKMSLRVWFLLLCASNIPSFWSHAKDGASEGRAIILDFVGMGYLPSKSHLLLLDTFIVFLQMVLTTISYERSLRSSLPSTVPDALLPPPTPLPPVTSISASSSREDETPKTGQHEPPVVIDLRIQHIIDRLCEPTPPVDTNATLPLPNTTSLPITSHLRTMIRRRDDPRRQTQTEHRQANTVIDTETSVALFPGGMGMETQ